MPSSLTHYAFNKDVLESSQDLVFMKDNCDIYLLGAQGPDPFFFYGRIPLKNKKIDFGSKLHKVSPSKNFATMFKYANKFEGRAKDYLYAYIYGAILHYLLDRSVHPYVFYRTGFGYKNSFYDHTLFETHLDVLLMNDYYKRYEASTIEAIKADENKVILVSTMYEDLAKQVYQDFTIDSKVFADSHKEMMTIQKILYSKEGVKKFFYKNLFSKSLINSMSHPLKVRDDDIVDYLNLRKNTWKNPASGVESNTSIIEIIEATKKEVLKWKEVILSAYNNTIDEQTLEIICDNTIYDGIKVGETMVHQDPVFEKGVAK